MKFLDALLKAKSENKQIVIPDIKQFSPKDGELLKNRKPEEYASVLVNAGAPVLSVVTEEKEFHGSLSLLRKIADAVDVPILRKDFIHTKRDLEETIEYGASAILLMCSCLEEEELRFLYEEALKLGLDPFVETHCAEDFALVKELGANLVGINNRDILQLEKDDGDVNCTVSLIGKAPKDAFLVTESSIKSPDEVRLALRNGADAALVGTAIARAPDPAVFYRMMTSKKAIKICGLMNEEDVGICVREGVEYIGFVCEYPVPVPWNLDLATVKELRKKVPAGFKTCIVTGGSNEKILRLAEEIQPDIIQLHYKETLEQTRVLSTELKKMGISVIKTVPASAEDRLEQFGTESLQTAISLLCETDVFALLVDPRYGADVGRTDLHADEDLFLQIKQLSSKPVILAGGINPDNISDLLAHTDPEIVDIMSGSEDCPGKKNRMKIRALTQAVQGI